MFIYKIENAENGKCYVGKTTQKPFSRFNQHMRLLRRGKHPNRHLQFAFNASSSKVFNFIVLDEAAFHFSIDGLEMFWIKHLDSFKNGYNLTAGGEGISGARHSEESKRKIGAASRERGGGKIGAHKLAGIQKSKEHVLKVAAANTGKKRDEATRLKIGATKIGNKNRCTIIVDSNGEKYPSVRHAAEAIGCKPDSISAVLTGKRKTLNKLTFFYAEKVGG